jgi:hypothetical protein
MNQLKLKEYMKILAKFPVKIRCRVYEALLLKEYVRIQVTNEDDVLDWEVVLDREPNFRLYCFSTEQEAYQFCEDVGLVIMEGINE